MTTADDAVEDDEGARGAPNTGARKQLPGLECGTGGGEIPSAEMEDFLNLRATGEANGATPRRHGGPLLGLLSHDDNDDVFDEDAGEAPTDEVADEPARGAREVDTRDEGFLSQN